MNFGAAAIAARALARATQPITPTPAVVTDLAARGMWIAAPEQQPAGEAVTERRRRIRFGAPPDATAASVLPTAAIIAAAASFVGAERKVRGEQTVPIAAQRDPPDTVLFEAPEAPATRYYLPRYRIVEADRKLSLRLAKRDGGWELMVDLEAFPAPELGDVAGASAIAHDLSVVLEVQTPVERRELAFTGETRPEGHTRATLALPTEAELTVVYLALTEPDSAARLVIRRTLTIAVPARPRIHIPLRPGSDQHEAPQVTEPQFVQTTLVLEHSERDPFVFPPKIYPYVFAGVEASGEALQYRLYHDAFGDREHRYYRDPMDPTVFRYLPDAYKIAREPEAPHRPMVRLRFLPGAERAEDVQVAMDYVAIPHVDPDRLARAAATLPAKLDDRLPAGQLPIFSPLTLPREKLSLAIALPGGAGFTRRTAAQVEPEIIRDTLTLPLAQFQAVYEALLGGSTVLLQGSVQMELPDATEQVRFIARADDMAGPILDEHEILVDRNHAIELTLRNAIESPVTVAGITARVLTEAGIENADVITQLPAGVTELAPGGELFMRIQTSSQSGAELRDALLRFATLAVHPDGQAIYEAILDSSTPAAFARTIELRGVQLLGAAAGDDAILAAVVQFENGGSTDLTPAARDGRGYVTMPLADVVLGRASIGDVAKGAYRYQVRLIRQRSQVLGPWIEDTVGVLYPLPPVPDAGAVA